MIEQEPTVTIPEGWLTTSEAAELTGYGTQRIRQLAREGRVRAVKIGHQWWVHKKALLEHHATIKPGPKAKRERGRKTGGKRKAGNGPAKQEPIVTVPDGWLTTSEAANLAGRSVGRVRQLVLAGQIRAVKIGGKWLVCQDDLRQRHSGNQIHCLSCGAELERRPVGRPREFCSHKCRVYHWRAEKRAVKGDPGPQGGFGAPIRTLSRVIMSAGDDTEYAPPDAVPDSGPESKPEPGSWGETKTVIRRQVHCLRCGAELEHRATGCPKRFCSSKCRMVYTRQAKNGRATARAGAALPSDPQPPTDSDHPIELAFYVINDDGSTTKWA